MNRKQRRASAKQPPAELASAFSQALALHQAGRLAEAEKIYRQILKVEHNHFDSLHLLGVIYHQRGSHAEAVLQIEGALKIEPHNVFALSNRGIALQELKRFDEALASYDKALSVRPELAEVHWNEACCRLLTGDFSRGWAKYEWRLKCESLARPKQNFLQPNDINFWAIFFTSHGARNCPFFTLTARPVCPAAFKRSVWRQRNAGICNKSIMSPASLASSGECTSVVTGIFNSSPMAARMSQPSRAPIPRKERTEVRFALS